MPSRSILVIPGFLARPAVITTTSEPLRFEKSAEPVDRDVHSRLGYLVADVQRLSLREARDDVDEDDVIDSLRSNLECRLSPHASCPDETLSLLSGEQVATGKDRINQRECRTTLSSYRPQAERLGEVLELAVGLEEAYSLVAYLVLRVLLDVELDEQARPDEVGDELWSSSSRIRCLCLSSVVMPTPSPPCSCLGR